MKKKILILLVLFFLIIFMFISSKEVMEVTKNNIDLLVNSFIPSLLPYMIIITLICELGGLDILGYFLQFIFSPIFGINGKTASLMLAGCISGYPLPSVMLSNQNTISEEEQQVISIFVFPSLAFLINQIVARLDNDYSSSRLFVSFFLGALILLFLERFNKKEKVEYVKFSTMKNILKTKYNNISIPSLWKKCIINSLINLCIISSNVIIFSLISAFLGQNSLIGTLFQGLLEFSRVSVKLADTGSYLQYLILISVLLWGGVSIFMQNSALLAHTNFSIKKYIIYRIKLIIIVVLIDILIFF